MKVRRRTKLMFGALKGRLVRERKMKLSDDAALFEIVRRIEFGEAGGRAAQIEDMIGSLKGGKPFNSVKEIDKVVYGL